MRCGSPCFLEFCRLARVNTSPVTIALLAVASSLATVATFELLRGSPLAVPATSVVEARPLSPTAGRTHEAEPHNVEVLSAVDPAHGQPTNFQIRLAELELRIAALEVDPRPARESESTKVEAQRQKTELRTLVLDWIAEEREDRRRAELLKNEQDRLTGLEFSSRYRANELAEQFNLADWEVNKLVDLFLEIEARRKEVEEGLDFGTVDPDEFEARWTEFDEWADQRYLDMLGQDLADKLLSDE